MVEIEEQPKVKLTKREKKAKYGAHYDEPLLSRREKIKSLLGGTKYREIIEDFPLYWEEDWLHPERNVMGSFIELYTALPDKGKQEVGKETLAKVCVNSFQKWMDENDVDGVVKRRCLNSILQEKALRSFLLKQQDLFIIISNIFDLHSKSAMPAVKEEIERHCSLKQYREAINLAVVFKLSDYPIQEFVLPLVAIERNDEIYEYLSLSVELQKDYASFLDRLIDCQSAFDLEKMLPEFKEPVKNPNRFLDKSMEKNANQFFNSVVPRYKYAINRKDHAPKFHEKHLKKEIKHIIGSRYDQNQMLNEFSYYQKLKEILDRQIGGLIEYVIVYLSTASEIVKKIDAASWIITYEMNPERFLKNEFNFNHYEKQARELLAKRKKETSHTGDYTLRWEDEVIKIELIETRQSLLKLVNVLKQKSSEAENLDTFSEEYCLGVDTEWRTSSNDAAGNLGKMSLIQLHLGKHVYLLDVLGMVSGSNPCTPPEDPIWKEFTAQFLTSNLYKIGFDLKNDIDALLEIPEFTKNLDQTKIRNVICLKKFIAQSKKAETSTKLSDFASELCGIQLDKTEQCGAWEVRPLRYSQLEYAAMDAYVVTKVFMKFYNETNDQKEAIERADVYAVAPEKEQKEKIKMSNFYWQEIVEFAEGTFNPSRPAADLNRLVLINDVMMGGTAKMLRRIGAHVIIEHDREEFRRKCRMMRNLRDRYDVYILTQPGKAYEELKNQFQDMVVAVNPSEGTSTPAQLKWCLSHFNIKLHSAIVYSRCLDCNSQRIARVPSEVLHFLHNYVVGYLGKENARLLAEYDFDSWTSSLERQGHRIERPSPGSKWIVVMLENAVLHITYNKIILSDSTDGTPVLIDKVPDDAFGDPSVFFYVCGQCGYVFWDKRRREARV